MRQRLLPQEPQESKTMLFIAACLVVLAIVGAYFYMQDPTTCASYSQCPAQSEVNGVPFKLMDNPESKSCDDDECSSECCVPDPITCLNIDRNDIPHHCGGGLMMTRNPGIKICPETGCTDDLCCVPDPDASVHLNIPEMTPGELTLYNALLSRTHLSTGETNSGTNEVYTRADIERFQQELADFEAAHPCPEGEYKISGRCGTTCPEVTNSYHGTIPICTNSTDQRIKATVPHDTTTYPHGNALQVWCEDHYYYQLPHDTETCTPVPGTPAEEAANPTSCSDPVSGTCAPPGSGSGSCLYSSTRGTGYCIPVDDYNRNNPGHIPCVTGSNYWSNLPTPTSRGTCDACDGSTHFLVTPVMTGHPSPVTLANEPNEDRTCVPLSAREGPCHIYEPARDAGHVSAGGCKYVGGIALSCNHEYKCKTTNEHTCAVDSECHSNHCGWNDNCSEG